MTSRLELLDVHGGTPEERQLFGPLLVLGRSNDVDWVFRDPAVSRRHAVIHHFADHDEIEDLGSRAGTLVNGQPLHGRKTLQDGDLVELASVRLRYAQGPGHAMPDFPPVELARSARLAPYSLRLLAFVLDVSVMLLVLIIGGLANALAGQLGDLGASAVSVGALALAVFIGFGVTNGTLAYLTDGQTVGKAFCGLIERRRATGPSIGEPAQLMRLVVRHTVGYLVIDVFVLGALTTFLLVRRRCLHDVVFDTEVVYVGGPGQGIQRVKAMDGRRIAALELQREKWGWAYHLLKWASGIAVTVLTVVATVLKLVSWLSTSASSSAVTPAVATAPAASAPSSVGVAGLVGITTTASLVAPVVLATGVGSSTDACDLLRRVDLKPVATIAFPAAQRLRIVDRYDETSGDGRHIASCTAAPDGNTDAIAFYTLDVEAGDQRDALSRAWDRRNRDLPQHPGAERIDVNDPRVERGVVRVDVPDDLRGSVQTVWISFVTKERLVNFSGDLDPPADWKPIFEDLLALTSEF